MKARRRTRIFRIFIKVEKSAYRRSLVEYRRLGNAGIKLSSIGLGGWTTFGDSIHDKKLTELIIKTAYDAGITFFDIADVYAHGVSEEMMGAVLRTLPRHTLVISSKVYFPMSDDVNDRGLSRKHIIESIDKSLSRIGTDYLDIYYCHRFDSDTSVEETIRAMDDLVHQGKVLYWGTSQWSGAQITESAILAESKNLYRNHVDQPGYSLLRRSHLETNVLPAARARGIGLTPFSPLANGMLTGKYDDGIPDDSRASRYENLRSNLTEETIDNIKKLKPIADELGITRAQLALAWILRLPEVSSVITGATKPEHVESNAKAAEINLDHDLIERIEALFPLDV